MLSICDLPLHAHTKSHILLDNGQKALAYTVFDAYKDIRCSYHVYKAPVRSTGRLQVM